MPLEKRAHDRRSREGKPNADSQRAALEKPHNDLNNSLVNRTCGCDTRNRSETDTDYVPSGNPQDDANKEKDNHEDTGSLRASAWAEM